MVKHLYMITRKPGETEPNQDAEWAVVQSCRDKGFEMPPVREGWRREMSSSVEIGQEPFPGAKPIWYWEVV